MKTTINRSCLAGLASIVSMQCTITVAVRMWYTCALVCIHMCSNVITSAWEWRNTRSAWELETPALRDQEERQSVS